MITTNGESGFGNSHYFNIIYNLFVCLYVCNAISSQTLSSTGFKFSGVNELPKDGFGKVW